MTVLVPPVTEIYLCDPTGVRIEHLDYCTSYEYVKVVNAISPCNILLPAKFDRSLIRLDNIIEIWRGAAPGTLRLDYCGFLRSWKYGYDTDNTEYTRLKFRSANELMLRRIVTGASGAATADKTDYADDMIKAIAEEQMGATAGTGRRMDTIGGGLTIEGDLSDGESMTKAFAYRNVLDVAQEIADASGQAGTRVYYELRPIPSGTTTGTLSFNLRTRTGQLGMDRTETSDTPIFVGPDWGNLVGGYWEEDYSEEVNWVKVVGQGEGTDRDYVEVSDSGRMEASIWNRREGTKDARHVEYGDTDALTSEGNTYLDEHKPRLIFGGDVVETPAFRYGLDWFLGDKVTVSLLGRQRDGIIHKVMIGRDENGKESIIAKLELLDLASASQAAGIG